MRKYLASILLLCLLASGAFAAADMGNTSVISPTDASNASGTCPSWSGSAAPSTLDDSARCLQGALAREWEARSFVTSTGTAPAFVVTQTVAPAAYRTGQSYCFTAHAAAVGTDTANFNSLGAKAIKKIVAGVKTATAANDFYTNDKVCGTYDGTDLVWWNRGSELSNYAPLASANTFTADQAIRSADAGATVGPLFTLDRNSATPAASDVLGRHVFSGRDDGGNTTNYVDIDATIVDPADGSEDGQLAFGTMVAGTANDRLVIRSGVYTASATGGDQGADTINATEYYKNGLRITRHLICTLATTSGTTHSCTNIPAYRELYIEISTVSFSASATMTMAVSDDNGANYGTARNIAVATGSAGGIIVGTIDVSNMQSSTWATARSITAIAPTATMTQIAAAMAEAGGGGAVINAIQFAGGTFDLGEIRVYGIL